MLSFTFSSRIRFMFSFLFGLSWLIFSLIIGYPWFSDLAHFIGYPLAIYTISSIALIPGFMNAFLFSTYLLDKQPTCPTLLFYPPISILIAAYNEEEQITHSIQSILDQNYPGELEIIVIDDGSTDQTAKCVLNLHHPQVKLLQPPRGGKSNALNAGLKHAKHAIIVTVDADTLLLKDALKHLIEHLEIPDQSRVASVGSVYAKNATQSWMANLQCWDYINAIALIKRAQSQYNGTLVAQGAFSAYRRRVLLEVNGWPTSAIGEDIVLTWSLLKKNYLIGYADNAIALTSVPITYKQFFRQRCRWARGLIEAFRYNPKVLLTKRLSTFFIGWNVLFPLIDLANLFIFLPGIIAAFFGFTYIASFYTLAYLPMGLANNMIILIKQKKLHNQYGSKIPFKPIGFFIYIFLYSLLMSPACVKGYFEEFFVTKKRWGTKK